jgi:branched-chain amino acid transport system ATP-binding protein/branched-chain amino acid transport system permease protein
LDNVNAESAPIMRTMGLEGIGGAQAGSLSYGGQRLLDMALALATRPRVLLLDEPLAGLAAQERDRVGRLIKSISTQVPVLLVEHDIDRVFALADAVTVMNNGEVLVDGTVADARESPKVQEVYIGSGSHALAERVGQSAAREGKLLELDSVNTFYGKSHILRDVGFDVRENEIVALLGRNGAGKSTLLKSIIGIAAAATGSIVLAGHELARRPAAEVARAGVAYVPQGRGLFAGMSVAHNLELGRLRRRTGHGTHWEEERIFEFFPRLRERLASPADYLSGGEQQMLAVARALSGDTRLLLLDEPFEGLSPAIIPAVSDGIAEITGLGRAILMAESNVHHVPAFAARLYVIERGEIIYAGRPEDVRRDRAVMRVIGGAA